MSSLEQRTRTPHTDVGSYICKPPTQHEQPKAYSLHGCGIRTLVCLRASFAPLFIVALESFSTSGTAQGGGGSFKHIGNLQEKLVVVNQGWQSGSTDGRKGGWNCGFGVVALVAEATSPTPAGCSVV